MLEAVKALAERLMGRGEDQIDLNIFRRLQNPYFADIAMDPHTSDPAPGHIFPTYNIEYTDQNGKRLLDRCRQHRARFEHDKDTEGVIVVVHPFYVFFQNRQDLEHQDYGTSAERYLQNLCALISDRDRRRWGLVFMEMPEHYAMFGSILLEAGLVDNVEFTEFDRGDPLEPERFKRLALQPEVAVAGGYIGRCLGGAIEAMAEYRQRDNILYLPEIILARHEEYLDGTETSVIFAHGLQRDNRTEVRALCV